MTQLQCFKAFNYHLKQTDFLIHFIEQHHHKTYQNQAFADDANKTTTEK